MLIQNCEVQLSNGTTVSISGNTATSLKILQFLSEMDSPDNLTISQIAQAKEEVRTIIRANPSQKISAIKLWREITGCSLKEAKDKVEDLMWSEFGIPYPNVQF